MASKTNVLDEIMAERVKPKQCGYCDFLRSIPDDSERRQWQIAALDQTYRKSDIAKVAGRRYKELRPNGVLPFGDSSLTAHRRDGHQMPA